MTMNRSPVERQARVKTDAAFRKENGRWYVSGDLTESADFSEMDVMDGEVTEFDFSEVRTISSCGLLEWTKWLTEHRVTPHYFVCAPPIVMHFNLVSELITPGTKVNSFQIPSYCHSCGMAVNYVATEGEDFHAGKPFKFALPDCARGACDVELDVDLDSYTYFVEELEDVG